MKRLIGSLLGLVAFAVSPHVIIADVTNDTYTALTKIGETLSLRFTLTSTNGVAGINGEVNYDPAVFSSPQVVEDIGMNGFTVLGNEMEPGKFRFVAYSNPVTEAALVSPFDPAESQPVLTFEFNVANDTGLQGTQEMITFDNAISAASTTDGVSIGVDGGSGGLGETVNFDAYTVNIAATGTESWLDYK